MISVIQNEDVYEIRFRYDPQVIDIIKTVPGRRWNPEGKFWSVPTERLGFLINHFKGTNYENDLDIRSDENLDQDESLESTDTSYLKNLDISDYDYRVASGLKPFQHQLDCLKFSIDRKRRGLKSGFILADQMGCGKTLETINLALYDKQFEGAKHCLIICCVNGSKYNWKEDIEKHTDGEYTGYILGSRVRRDGSINYLGSGKDKVEDLRCNTMYGKKGKEPLPFFLIMNIEAIRTKEGKDFVMVQELQKMITQGELSMIAIDEVHKNASPTSIQGQQLMKLKKGQNRLIEWIPITGTPIVNKPTDVFLPLRLIDGHMSNSYWSWCQKYCVYGGYGDHEIISYKNMDQLKNMLQPNMIRRLKKDIMDLPPKIRNMEYVEPSPYQKKLYESVRDELLGDTDQIVKSPNPMNQFLRLRQVNCCPEVLDEDLQHLSTKEYLKVNSKMKRCLELIEDIVNSNGDKVVIFSNFLDPLRTLHKILVSLGHKVCVYTGTMDQELREQHKTAFIKNPTCKIILGTIGALGTSHTLTVAHDVIFLDEPWNMATLEQAEDRCHRAGTTQTVNIHSIITRDSVDEKVHDIINKKSVTANFIVDNKLDFKNHPELIQMLLA